MLEAGVVNAPLWTSPVWLTSLSASLVPGHSNYLLVAELLPVRSSKGFLPS